MRVARNKGHYIERKNGTFQVRYPLGWDAEKGRYTDYTEEALSEFEAATALKEINDFVYHGGDVNDIAAFRRPGPDSREDAVDFATFVEQFLAAREKGKRFAARTLHSDSNNVVSRFCGNILKPYPASRDRVAAS